MNCDVCTEITKADSELSGRLDACVETHGNNLLLNA